MNIIPTRPDNREVVEIELSADTLTPVGAALRAGAQLAFLLESVEGGVRYGRHSVLGIRGRMLTVRDDTAQLHGLYGELLNRWSVNDPLEALRQVLPEGTHDSNLPLPIASGVGYLGYEAAAYWEHLPVPDFDPVGLPTALFHLPSAVVVFDHLEQKARLATIADSGRAAAKKQLRRLADRLSEPVSSERPQVVSDSESRQPAALVADNEKYEVGVASLVKQIHDGEMLQTVLAQRFSIAGKYDPFTIYRALRRINPSPYLFFVNLAPYGAPSSECTALVGASPELLVRVRDGQVITRPIAGTRPRHEDPAQDLAFEQELRADEKELAEHAMLVDLARNDVGRVASAGSVTVPLLRSVERYSHVMHLVSEVHGQLRDGLDAFDALRATFPAGTVSGAPKVRAMQEIAALEQERRGPYGGAVGVFSPEDLEAAITIRSAVISTRLAHVHAGAGIVADSDPAREAAEVAAKAGAMRAALAAGELLR